MRAKAKGGGDIADGDRKDTLAKVGGCPVRDVRIAIESLP